MGIAVGGLASGIDSDAIIAQLMAIEEQRIFQIQRRIALEEQKKAAYDDLSGRVDALKRASAKFSDSDIFGELQVNSSNTAILSARSRFGTAEPGSYSVKVKQAATSHRIAAQGFADKTGTGVAAAAGQFSFKIGPSGSVTTIDVDESTSLQAFANKINDAKKGVTATIVDDGSALNSQRLVLTATSEGENGTIIVTENDTSLDFANKQVEAVVADSENAADYEGTVTSGGTYTGTANTSFIVEIMEEGLADGTAKYRLSTDGGLTFDDNAGAGFDVTSAGPIGLADGVTISFEDDGILREGDSFSIDVFNPELRTPQDAIIEVNGITVRKSSNTINDVFEGLTFDIASASPNETVNITVERDAGSVEESLTSFIGAYNGVVGFLRSQFAYDPADGGLAPPLNGDSAARQVDRDIKRIISTRMDGLSGSEVSTISELGIDSNEKTGLLSFNPMKLSELMRDDPTAVERVLTRFGERTSGDFTFTKRTSATKPGIYDVNVSQARTRATLTAGAPAEALAANEDLTLTFNRRAQTNGNPIEVNVSLLAGDTPEQQISKLNTAFEDRSLDLTAFLDADGAITMRSTEYGDDYAITALSTLAAGAGTTQLGNAVVEAIGTDLAGTIGGVTATVVEGNRLKGGQGFRVEGLEVTIPDDADGALGKVRIVDGLSEKFPKVLDGLIGFRGVLRSRTDGVSTRIKNLEDDIIKQQRRMAMQEERLRRQFTNMEVTMGKLDALGSYVEQQMAAISGQNKKK
ncbi:MAG: flagellar filament capping protein FliD [Bradymonadia bacterium]